MILLNPVVFTQRFRHMYDVYRESARCVDMTLRNSSSIAVVLKAYEGLG